MEWLVMMGGGLNAVSSNLGWHNGEFYEVSDECEENLCEMITSLKNENRVTRPVRRTYAASRLIEMDLFPILTASKDQPDVYHRVVQLLVELTMPMEITMPCYSSMNTEDVRTRDALKKMLIQVKKLFNDKKVTEAIVNQMRYVLIESKTEESWDKSMFEPVEDSLKLVRNILHICDDSLSLQIIQSLMSAGFGDVIIEVCEAEVQTSLVSSILAIICLLFRNYNANDIENEARKLVAASESCPPESSQMSEEMQQDAEVSSDNSKCASSPGLPVDNLQIAEGGCKEVSVKDALKPIMVRFALKFVKGSLNEILKTIAKTEINQFFTDLHFLWHLTFFLPLTMIPTIKYQHISTFLSPAVICTLSYLTLDTWEQYNKAQQNKKDSESNMCFKRLHLLMTCQHYYFSCLHHFHGIAQTAEESERLQHSISSVMQAKSIHLMYVLLLRKYKSNMETLAYLKELINGNHKLLALSNFANSQSSFEMREHIKCFATPKVVLTYNELLKLFATNTLAVNERIMHMYHHIVIDLNKPELLHQVPILSTISEMWAENSDRISQESYELMDYVIFLLCKKYISSKKRKAMRCVLTNPYTNWRKEKQKKKKLKRLKKEFTMKNLDNISHTGLYILPTSSEGEISEDEQDGTVEENVATLKKIGYSKELKLLQDLLLEMCSLKLDCSARHMAEPHVWPYASVGKSVPMVAYTQGQELLQEEEIFSSLMRQLGIQKDSSHLFPTIPSFWTAEMCFETASKLGPLDPADFKFEVTESGKPKFESQRTFLPEESGKEAKPSSSSSSSHKSVQDQSVVSQSSIQPSHQPTNQPTHQPTNQPTHQPTNQPTNQPTHQPTNPPTNPPTIPPTNPPTNQPTNQPTHQPTHQPTSVCLSLWGFVRTDDIFVVLHIATCREER